MSCDHGYTRGPAYCPFCRRMGLATPPTPDTGKARKDKGMKEAEAGADPRWFDEALVCIRQLANVRVDFDADDVRDMLDALGLHTDNPSALGPVFKRAQANGWITPTDHYRPSRRAAAHQRPLRVWDSAIREESVA